MISPPSNAPYRRGLPRAPATRRPSSSIWTAKSKLPGVPAPRLQAGCRIFRSDRVGESIAGRKLPAVEAPLEPAHALRRRAVVEALRHDIALRTLLQRIVADLL